MLFTIRDIENLSGIKAHTIRIWEQRYSFIKPKRSDTNIRYYSNDELKVILNIALLNKYGYKISHISKMSRDVIHENVLSLTDAKAKNNIIINQLLQNMIEYDLENFSKTLNHYIHKAGIEKCVLQIIFPFLDMVGTLWLTNHVNPAQERLVSNFIRQKIISAIEQLPEKISSDKKICLFLPEGEYHELSLLYVDFLLRKKGVDVIYLGANIPLEELRTINNIKKPDYLYTHLTVVGQNFNFEKFISALSKDFNNCSIVISGRLTACYVKKIPQKIIFKHSLEEVKEFISQL